MHCLVNMNKLLLCFSPTVHEDIRHIGFCILSFIMCSTIRQMLVILAMLQWQFYVKQFELVMKLSKTVPKSRGSI